MGNFSIKVGNSKSVINEFEYYSSRVNGLAGSVKNISNTLSLSDNIKGIVKSNLMTISNRLQDDSNKLSQLKNGINNIISQYENTEKNIINNAKNIRFTKTSIDDSVSGIANVNANETTGNNNNPQSAIVTEIEDREGFFGKKSISMFLEDVSGNVREKFVEISTEIENKLEIGPFEKKKKRKDVNEYEEYYDKNGNLIDDDSKKIDMYDKDTTLLEYTSGSTISATLYNKTYDGKFGTVETTVGNAEVHSNVSAGLYRIKKGKDGQEIKTFSPAVSAEIGGSVTALEIKGETEFGSDMLGASGEAKFVVGHAESAAEANLMLYGEDGKLNLQVNAGVSAEAILVGVEGKAAAKILGGEAAVNGKLNVGIGAHADVGIKDGVVKADLGLALGVGASIAFEVDVGGMVNTVTSAAETGIQKLKESIKFW